MRFFRSRVAGQGSTLAEIVIALGLLGGLLLLVAAMAVQTHRGGKHMRTRVEARSLAENLLERQLSKDLKTMPLTPTPLGSGKLADQTPYQALLECELIPGTSASAGLTGSEIRCLRVRLRWSDNLGPQEVVCESYLSRIPR